MTLISGDKCCQADTECASEPDDLTGGEDTWVFSHVKLTLFPGCVKRFRIFVTALRPLSDAMRIMYEADILHANNALCSKLQFRTSIRSFQ